MFEIKDLIEALEAHNGKDSLFMICNYLGLKNKMPLENEHKANVQKIMEETPDVFAYDEIDKKWYLVKSKAKKESRIAPTKTNHGTGLKAIGFDRAVEYALSIFEKGKLSDNLEKTKKDMTQKLLYKGKLIGCVYYVNRDSSNYSSFEFTKGFFDKTKYDLSKYNFEDREEYYRKKAQNGTLGKKQNDFLYKIRFNDFEEVRELIEAACEDITNNF